jgi:hypothetical protein
MADVNKEVSLISVRSLTDPGRFIRNWPTEWRHSNINSFSKFLFKYNSNVRKGGSLHDAQTKLNTD